jgi:hypothetical protein
MKNFLISLGLLLFVGNTAYSQDKVYELYDKTPMADISYMKLDSLNTTSSRGMKLLESVFKPAKGNYTVYRFIATFKGESVTGGEKEFHDLLIVKTDKTGKILDALQYTLEWAEPPMEFDLYKAHCENVYLVDGLSIEKFRFTRPWYVSNDSQPLNDKAIVQLIKK